MAAGAGAGVAVSEQELEDSLGCCPERVAAALHWGETLGLAMRGSAGWTLEPTTARLLEGR